MRAALTDDGMPPLAAVGLTFHDRLARIASDRPGLFASHDSPGIPQTNNDLEHLFGSHRYQELRSSGRRRPWQFGFIPAPA